MGTNFYAAVNVKEGLRVRSPRQEMKLRICYEDLMHCYMEKKNLTAACFCFFMHCKHRFIKERGERSLKVEGMQTEAPGFPVVVAAGVKLGGTGKSELRLVASNL